MLETEGNISEGQVGSRPNRNCVHHVYALGEIFPSRKDAGMTTCRFFLDVQNGSRHSKEKWPVEGAVGKWDRRDDVEKTEEYGGTNQKCDDDWRGSIEVLRYYKRCCPGMYVITRSIKIFIHDLKMAIETAR